MAEYGGKPGVHTSGSKGSMGYGSKGLEAKPGDRGDASNYRGCMGLKTNKSPDMPPQLKSEASEGYEAPVPGWHGNVKR